MEISTRESLESEFSDAYKAANGVRPRWSLVHMSEGELDAEITSLYREAAADARIPSGGDGWSFEGAAEVEAEKADYDPNGGEGTAWVDSESGYFDDYNDFGGSMFGMTYDEAPGCGEDY